MPYNYGGNYIGNNGNWMSNQGNNNVPYNVNNVPGYYQASQPMNYVQQPNYYSQAPQQSQNHTGINWVQGRAGANSFYVAPGQSALLMDSEESVLYVKSVDVTGRPMPLEVYDLVKRDNVVDVPQISQKNAAQNTQNVSQPADMSQYVKMSDLETKVHELVNKALEG